MKYSTAIGHLEQLAASAGEMVRLRETDIGWAIEELWAGEALLDGPAEIDATPVVVILDEPPDELPWLALPPGSAWIRQQLRLDKLPIDTCYRPTVYPAWNCRDRRVARFWSAREGLDGDVVERLRERRVDELAVVRPSHNELARQFESELADARRHLHRMLDEYWEPGWRREHRGFGVYPDDHLWRAAEGVRDLEDAVAQLRSRHGERAS